MTGGDMGPLDSFRTKLRGVLEVTARPKPLLDSSNRWEKDRTVASHDDSPPAALRDVRRCVILSRGDDVPPGFLASLSRHGVEAVVIGHPLRAFAELLAREIERPKDGGWGLPERNRSALIVADRDRWERLDTLLEAMKTHLPRVAVWVASANLLLEVRVGDEGTSSFSAAASDGDEPDALRDDSFSAEREYPHIPQLRLAGEVDETNPSASPPHPPAIPEAITDTRTHASPSELDEDERRSIGAAPFNPSVTPEEIEMLLKLLPDASPPPTPGHPPRGPLPPSGGTPPEKGHR